MKKFTSYAACFRLFEISSSAIVICFFVSITSCSLKKKVSHANPLQVYAVKKQEMPSRTLLAGAYSEDHTVLRSSDVPNEKSERASFHDPAANFNTRGDTCKGVILLKNGEEINAKVTDTVGALIHFIDCANGRSASIQKQLVFSLRDEKGNVDLIKYKEVADINDQALTALIYALVIFAVPVFQVVAIIRGFIAMKEIRKSKGRERGMKMAKFSIIFSIVWMSLLLSAYAFLLISG